ncbi:MAG: hypothetical protein AMXMBFR78_34190 [Rubrivivax sp.]
MSLRIACPCCAAELSLDALLTHEQARRAVARLAQVSLPFGALTLRYMALFKPASRALSIERMVRLIDELLPDIERRAVTRHGRDWPADLETWRAAMQIVVAMRDEGTLRLPLTGHGLLYQVIANLQDKAEAQAERTHEAARRQRREAGARGVAPRDLSAMAADVASSPMPLDATGAPAVPPPSYAGPSRAALALRAQIEAAQAARANAPSPTPEGASRE